MAEFQSTTLNGNSISANYVWQSGSDVTPWMRLYHCADAPDASPSYSAGYLHVRTPIPIEGYGAIQNIPTMLEIVGFHTYDGNLTHDSKTIINVNESDAFQYNVRVNVSYGSLAPYLYKSTSTYGGYKRLCFSVRKEGCCCVGWLWIRWWMNSNLWNNYAWGQTGGASQTTSYF
jgi:hypothetical protein